MQKAWRVKREICEKGATWTDWIPTSCRPSHESHSSRAFRAVSCARWILFCIRMLVQVIDSARPSLLFRAASGVVAGLCVATLMSCSFFSSRDDATLGYHLPLTVQLRSDPSIAGAQLIYQDACGQRQSLSIGAPLQNMLKRKTGLVFEKVLMGETGPSSAPDGYVDAALGLASVDLVIPRKATKSIRPRLPWDWTLPMRLSTGRSSTARRCKALAVERLMSPRLRAR